MLALVLIDRVISFVFVCGALACTPADPPPANVVPPYPGKPGTWGAPNAYPPPASEPSSASTPSAPSVSASATPSAPCKDGTHAPACVDGVCVVRAYKC